MAKNNSKKVSGYKAETIKKVIDLLKYWIAYFIEQIHNGVLLNPCISSGNKKIGRVLNVSLAPIITCANCGKCLHYCYDIKAVLQYLNVLVARAKNTAMVMEDRDRFFQAIDKKCERRRKNLFFRWHVSGDIVDMDYLERMIALARKYPEFTFWTYTKNYVLVNMYVKAHGGRRKEAIPENLSIMFSEWEGMDFLNPYNFPVFCCKMGEDDNRHEWQKMHLCPGNCDICKETKRGCIVGEDTYCNLH